MIPSVLLTVAVVVILLLVIVILQRRLRWVQLSVKSGNPKSQPDQYKYKLLHYSPNVTDSSVSYGMFQKGNEYWLVNSKDITEIVNLRDLYPAFKGRPIGMVIVPGTQVGTSAFLIFSSDGKVYNPFTVSHPFRRDFLYLPNEDPMAVDGRPLSSGVKNGLFSGGGPSALTTAEGALLLRFYYNNHYIEESGCVVGVDPGSSASAPRSCKQKDIAFPHPNFRVVSYYQYAGSLYGISPDGYIYKCDGTAWTKDISWLTLFSGLTIPDSVPLAPSDRTKLYLMGADYDNGVPVFLIYENGKRYLVDRSARKYDFSEVFKNKGVLPPGNPLDFTKAGPGEFDYIALYNNGKIYGPSLPAEHSHSRAVSDFTGLYPGTLTGSPSSVTSVNKWQSTGLLGSMSYAYHYYLVFLYDSGQWFEVQYDIKSNTIIGLGQTDQISGKWTEWPHVKSALSGLSKTQTFKVSSFGWSVFVFDEAGNTGKNLVYSINEPPVSWLDMLYCTSKDNGDGTDGFKTDRCVGLGSWQNYSLSQLVGASGTTGSYQGFLVYEDLGVDIDSNPGAVTRKISLDQCLQNNKNRNAVVYDQNESDCHVYDTLLKVDSLRDPTKNTFIAPGYDATYQNRFCVKHVPSNRYLYWDFTDPNNQHLSLMDQCIYSGNPNILTEDPKTAGYTGDVQSLQRSLGAMWSLTGSGGLENMNGVMGGFLQGSDNTMKMSPDGNFYFMNGMFTNRAGSCFRSDGAHFNMQPCQQGEWKIESIPCPNFISSTGGYINQYCLRQ